MRKLTFKLVIPLTILSFVFFTKWWYASLIDIENNYFYGFPLAYNIKGFHTSMAEQFFIKEFFIDITVYFGFWYLLVYSFNRFIKKIRVNLFFTFLLVGSSLTLTTFITWYIYETKSDHHFHYENPYKERGAQILETGFMTPFSKPEVYYEKNKKK